MNIKILILGCNGFFGKNLKFLLKNEEYIFYYLDRQTVDIQNLSQLNDVFLTFKPDVVINCSGLIGSSESNKELDQLFILNTNITININVLTCCKNNNVKKIIMFSSYRIFLNSVEDNYDEHVLYNLDFTHNCNNTGYLLSKKIMHLQIDLFKQTSNVNIICFILPNIFGSYDLFSTNGRIVPSLINKIKIAKQENTTLIINGNEHKELNIIYINDIINIINICIQKNNINGDIIIFDKNAVVSLRELCNILAQKINYYNEIIFLDDMHCLQNKLYIPNTTKFNSYFEDFKFTDLNNSLQETINFYLS
jgi:nucleoside-diphosphate-sugar epimerase